MSIWRSATGSGLSTLHDMGGADHIADTLANLNSKVSDATLIDTGDSRLSDARTPTAHNLAGSEHNADTLSNLNSKVSDATLDDSGDSRPPSGSASGDLDGSYPNPTVNEGNVDHDLLLNYVLAQHRIINDAGSTTTELLSASKILSITAAISAGIDNKAFCDTSTEGVGNITLSGEQTLNGLLTSASRILVLEQTLGEDNGFYTTAAGSWSRTTDADSDAEMTNGVSTMVSDSGSDVYRHHYLLTTADPITLGTTPLVFDFIPDLDFGTTSGTATEGDDTRIPVQDENDALVGTNGTPSTSNKYVTNSDSRNTDSRTPTAHGLGGAEHSADTLANLNSKVSDATLIDTGDSRIPIQGENDALIGTNGTPSTSNKYVTNSDPRLTLRDQVERFYAGEFDYPTLAGEGFEPAPLDIDHTFGLFKHTLDDTTAQGVLQKFRLKDDVNTAVSVVFNIKGKATSYVTNSIVLKMKYWAVALGTNLTPSPTTVTLGTFAMASSSGQEEEFTVSLSYANLTGWGTDVKVRFVLYRDTGDGGDNLVGDFELTEFSIELPRV